MHLRFKLYGRSRLFAEGENPSTSIWSSASLAASRLERFKLRSITCPVQPHGVGLEILPVPSGNRIPQATWIACPVGRSLRKEGMKLCKIPGTYRVATSRPCSATS